MTELNHKTFDLAAVLSGLDFPEHTVTVYLDEAVGFEIYRAEQALRNAEIRGNEESLKEIADRLDSLREKRKDAAYKVTLKGIPESSRRACDAIARKEFPPEYEMLTGLLTPNPERDDLYNRLIWTRSLVLFENSKGEAAILSDKLIKQLREEAGTSVFRTISDAIRELEDGVKSGFETNAQDVDFLSGA